jgi:hypothetical protein
MEEQLDYINSRQRFIAPRIIVPKVDEPVSMVVGKKVMATDPRLIKLIVKFKRNKPADSMEPDNLLVNPQFVKELKELFK